MHRLRCSLQRNMPMTNTYRTSRWILAPMIDGCRYPGFHGVKPLLNMIFLQLLLSVAPKVRDLGLTGEHALQVPYPVAYRRAKSKILLEASSKTERDSARICRDLDLTRCRALDISLAPDMLAKSQNSSPALSYQSGGTLKQISHEQRRSKIHDSVNAP